MSQYDREPGDRHRRNAWLKPAEDSAETILMTGKKPV